MKTDGIVLRVLGTYGVCRTAAIVWAEFLHRDWTVALGMLGAVCASLALLWSKDGYFH